MRLDQWLVVHGHAATRSRAQWLIEAGQVRINGRPCGKAATAVSDRDGVTVHGAGLPYVSRGGLKLEHALQAFRLEAVGLVALDVGASTGGFTDCLLQHGARRVYALDVGTGLLAPTLRLDPRVVVLEGRNFRTFQVAELPEPVDLITVDVSFVSLTLLMPLLPPLVRPYGRVIALVKPQFEVGPARVGRGGVVRHIADRVQALNRVLKAAGESGFRVLQCVEAPPSRGQGNQEVFISLLWDGAVTHRAEQMRVSAWQAHASQLAEPDLVHKAGSLEAQPRRQRHSHGAC
jgi:23S rRNA (cytidine1920-2'-O)/16S rRNA (cytidine1409-2'-O)-methyltransferase